MTVWRVIRKGSGIRSHHYFLLLKITGPNLFGPYFSVIFGLTGPICARSLKSLHLLELRPRGHHDWPVTPTNRQLTIGPKRLEAVSCPKIKLASFCEGSVLRRGVN